MLQKFRKSLLLALGQGTFEVNSRDETVEIGLRTPLIDFDLMRNYALIGIFASKSIILSHSNFFSIKERLF